MAAAIFTEGILIIASVILAAGLSTTVLSKVGVFQSTFSATTENQKQITLTKIKVVYATNSSSTEVNAFVKNIGIAPVNDPASVDVYFGPLGSAQRIPYNNGTAPTWTYASPVTVWQEKNTVQIDITESATLQQNLTYMLRVTTPNGISDDYLFSLPA